jgi:hypothetical protein
MLKSVFGFLVPKKEFANSVVPESANRDLEGKLGERHRVVGHFFYREQLKSKNAARIPHFSYRKVGRIDESEGKVDGFLLSFLIVNGSAH